MLCTTQPSLETVQCLTARLVTTSCVLANAARTHPSCGLSAWQVVQHQISQPFLCLAFPTGKMQHTPRLKAPYGALHYDHDLRVKQASQYYSY